MFMLTSVGLGDRSMSSNLILCIRLPDIDPLAKHTSDRRKPLSIRRPDVKFPLVSRDGDLSWPLRRAARLYGDVVGVTDADRSLTYEGLARRVAGLGTALSELEIPVGARVGFLGANSLAHLECWLGVPAFGHVLVDLNFRLAEDELAFMVEDAGVELLVVDADQLEVARALRERSPSLRHLVLDAPDQVAGDCLKYEDLVTAAPGVARGADPDALAAISYTGGTTGLPKGVMLSHGNLLSNARHNLLATKHRAGDQFLHVCPMFHAAGTANVFACTWVGAGQVILPRFDAEAVLATIERERISHTVLVPTMLAMLLDAPGFSKADLKSLRNVQYAASPISPELQQRVLERLDCEVAQFYGMTEAAPTVTHLSPEDHRLGFAGHEPQRSRLASMGVPVPGVEVEVRGLSGEMCGPGDIGELWVRGPNVMLGYWNRPEATESALVDGWYRTGDAAYADQHGYLYMVDRLKDMIITGGENVYSIEVESALYSHPAVLEAAVFGVPHDKWGEAVHAVVTVTPDADVTQQELIAHCRASIAGFKVPRTVDLRLEPLPKSGAGKVLKNRLREKWGAAPESGTEARKGLDVALISGSLILEPAAEER
jgi:long-chain acyl-CoA synthetase